MGGDVRSPNHLETMTVAKKLKRITPATSKPKPTKSGPAAAAMKKNLARDLNQAAADLLAARQPVDVAEIQQALEDILHDLSELKSMWK